MGKWLRLIVSSLIFSTQWTPEYHSRHGQHSLVFPSVMNSKFTKLSDLSQHALKFSHLVPWSTSPVTLILFSITLAMPHLCGHPTNMSLLSSYSTSLSQKSPQWTTASAICAQLCSYYSGRLSYASLHDFLQASLPLTAKSMPHNYGPRRHHNHSRWCYHYALGLQGFICKYVCQRYKTDWLADATVSSILICRPEWPYSLAGSAGLHYFALLSFVKSWVS